MSETSADREFEDAARLEFETCLECTGLFDDMEIKGTCRYHPIDWVLRGRRLPHESWTDYAYIEYKRRHQDQEKEFWVDMYKLCSMEMLSRMSGIRWWLLVEYNDATYLHISVPTRYQTRFLESQKLPMGVIDCSKFTSIEEAAGFKQIVQEHLSLMM